MDISTLRNPYDYAHPVRSAELFAGRQPELSHIAYVLAQTDLDKPVSFVAVHGQRAAGKTSVLNRVEAIAADRDFVVVRLNLVPTDVSPEAFFAKLFEELAGVVQVPIPSGGHVTPRQIRRVIGGTAPDFDFPLDFPEALAQARTGMSLSEMALRQDLVTFVRYARTPIAVLVDEAQVIAGSADVLSMLRTIGMQLNGMTFVLAGTTELIERVNLVFDHLLRQFEFVKIGRFEEREEVRKCVSLPLKSVGLIPEACFLDLDTVVRDLMDTTDGIPYEIQLICHTMFTRWQAGKTRRMEFSAALLDEILRGMDERRRPQEHPLIDKVKLLTNEQLRALNILCSGLGSATRKQTEFAHLVYGPSAMSAEALEQAQEELISAGVIDVVDGRVEFDASLFEVVYTRLWSHHRLGTAHHPQLINSLSAKDLLTRQLEYILCDLRRGIQAFPVSGCYNCTTPDVMETSLAEIQTANAANPPEGTAAYDLAAVIAQCGAPQSIDIAHVTLESGELLAHRWVVSPTDAAIDLSSLPDFLAAQARVRSLGGTMFVVRRTIRLPAWESIEEWLATEDKARLRYHDNAFWIAYERGDLRKAADHLMQAYAVAPNWERANNVSYIALRLNDVGLARDWVAKAERNNPALGQLALTQYNAAMAAVIDGNLDSARAMLSAATGSLDLTSSKDHSCRALLVPDSDHALVEHQSVTLTAGIALAQAALTMDSASANTMVRRDEPVRPPGG